MTSLLRSSFGYLGPSAATYDAVVLADGPEAFWKLDEPNGSATVADSTGNGNTGTVSATAPTPGLGQATAPGTIGGTSLGIAGSGNPAEYYGINPQAGLLAALQNHDFSIESWSLRATPMLGNTPNMIFNAGNARANDQQFIYDYNTGGFAVGFWNDDWQVPSAGTQGDWHQTIFAWVHATKVGTWYTDGASVGNHTFAASLNVNNLGWSIGANPNTAIGWNAWNGNLSRISVYNYVLTATQAAVHFAAAT